MGTAQSSTFDAATGHKVTPGGITQALPNGAVAAGKTITSIRVKGPNRHGCGRGGFRRYTPPSEPARRPSEPPRCDEVDLSQRVFGPDDEPVTIYTGTDYIMSKPDDDPF